MPYELMVTYWYITVLHVESLSPKAVPLQEKAKEMHDFTVKAAMDIAMSC